MGFTSGFRAGITGKKMPGKKTITIAGEEYVLKKKKKKKKR